MADPAQRRGLGRGLSALLGEAEQAAATDSATPDVSREPPRELPIELLRRNPDQPRRRFDETELDELSNSIREKGVLQPILVRPAPGAKGEYQIVAGERRWRAAQRAGLRALPVIVRELDDLDVLEIGVIENVQRADLNALEEAQGYRTLIERFGRTQDEVAKTVGKSRSHVANAVRLLALPDAVREHVIAGRLSAGHARAIAASPQAERLAERIVAGGLSVRQAEGLARAPEPPLETKSAKAPPRGRGKDADTRALEQDLSDTLGLPVEIADRRGKGTLTLHYASLDQLDDLCRKLSGG